MTKKLALLASVVVLVIAALLSTSGLAANAADAPTAVPAAAPAAVSVPAPAAAPAASGAASCTGSNLGSGGLIKCSRGGATTAWKTVPGWTVATAYPNQTCVDSNGNTSYRGDLVNKATGGSLPNYCLVAHKPVGGAQVVDQKDLLIQKPVPTADFTGKFLTGAEIKFTAPQLIDYAQTLALFPGATVVANPVNMVWDFGDGTTSTEASPTHTYTTSTPNQQNPTDHNVTVTVTGTWQLYLHPADNGVVQDLGQVVLNGQINRPIVSVWSAPTEPNANV